MREQDYQIVRDLALTRTALKLLGDTSSRDPTAKARSDAFYSINAIVEHLATQVDIDKNDALVP